MPLTKTNSKIISTGRGGNSLNVFSTHGKPRLSYLNKPPPCLEKVNTDLRVFVIDLSPPCFRNRGHAGRKMLLILKLRLLVNQSRMMETDIVPNNNTAWLLWLCWLPLVWWMA